MNMEMSYYFGVVLLLQIIGVSGTSALSQETADKPTMMDEVVVILDTLAFLSCSCQLRLICPQDKPRSNYDDERCVSVHGCS